MAKNKIIYLIDGTAYIYRGYYAIRNLSNSAGLPTNAVFGFTRMLLKLIEEKSPEYMVMAFDAKGPTFRHEVYKDYKANRPPMPEDMALQLPYIKKVTAGFNIPIIEIPGYEADDIIGTLSRMAEDSQFSVVMVTGDKDFVQLVSNAAIIYDPMKDKTIDLSTVEETYGVSPDKIIDIMGLSGDTSDNIPGVPGIGPKTAISLIKTFGSMDRLYDEVDTITKKKQHENLVKYKEQALLSRQLVTIETKVPIELDLSELKMKEPDEDILSVLFRELEFRQLQRTFQTKRNQAKKEYQSITDEIALSKLVSLLETESYVALDTETTSLDPLRAGLVGISIAFRPHQAFYIPCGHDPEAADRQLPIETIRTRLGPILENPEIKKIGQNIKYDWAVLLRHGFNLRGVYFDTMVASYLINPSKRAHNLDQIALDFLDHKTIKYEDVAGKGKQAVTFDNVPLEKAVPYACEDADVTLMAYEILSKRLAKMGLSDLFETVEMPLVSVLMDMELAGIEVDTRKLRELSEGFQTELETIEDQIYSLAGERFNIRSSKKLGEILFEKLGLPVQKKTRKTKGYSTDEGVLTILSDKHELPALVLRHRKLSKLKSTYTDALIQLVNPESGRIHTSFNQTVTATGRLSSSDPNLQNIPIRTEEGRQIRETFIPRAGWLLLAADYSQIELRILAHCSNDPIMVEGFARDEDIHTRTATEIFETFPSFITPELRRQAKAVNFGIIYGMSAFRLSNELGISQKMAKTYIKNYFNRYKGVKAFIDTCIESVEKTKQTSTLLGRIRLIPEIDSKNRTVRNAAERTAINTQIQGTAADLIKVAMIKVAKEIKERRLKSKMLLSVHDEIIFEVPPDEKQIMHDLVRDTMENAWELNVPLKVNLAFGKNWAQAH